MCSRIQAHPWNGLRPEAGADLLAGGLYSQGIRNERCRSGGTGLFLLRALFVRFRTSAGGGPSPAGRLMATFSLRCTEVDPCIHEGT